ncbi:MAG: inorganic diphosphatase [Firmicutes bacterium]|nr:inorganic diphosphatase [Bacillota bacterium]
MIVQTIIEIPHGSQNKYEYDVTTGKIRLDRVLHAAMHYPVNYGFIPETWAEDNDPLDVLAMASTAIAPGIEVTVRVIGVLWMEDEHGLDAKIIGVVDTDPRFGQIKTMTDIGNHRLREIRHFFQEYKTLQGIVTTVGNFQDQDVAVTLIQQCQQRFLTRKSPGGDTHVYPSYS